jgi:hypothetical protein
MSALPWYKSQVLISQIVTVISAITAIAPKVATALGLTSVDAINQTVTAVFGVIAVAATAYGAVRRVNSPLQPLTLTQADADAHPATVATQVAPVPVVTAKVP